ncbi:hypothetical protein Tco_1040716, partial [Tanacetum coccineum]
DQAQEALLEEIIQPTSDNDFFGPDKLDISNLPSSKLVPDPNIPLNNGTVVTQDDEELDDLISSFQRLSEKASVDGKPIERIKRKHKHKTKKLVVESVAGSQTISFQRILVDDLDDDRRMRNMLITTT